MKVITNFSMILIGMLQIILGIILIFINENLLTIIFKVLGIVLLIVGLIQIINSILKQKVNEYANSTLITGSLSAVIGILLVTKAGLATEFLTVILGVWIMINGILQISSSITVKNLGVKYWPVVTFIGIAVGVLGYILLSADAQTIANIFNTYIGISLALSGVGAIITAFSSKREVKVKVQVVEETITEKTEEM